MHPLDQSSSAGTKTTDSEGPPAPVPAPRVWNLPNQLTIARMVLSLVFFVLLAIERGEPAALAGLRVDPILNLALVVFVLAVLTDTLDGHLARKWKLVSTFGRIADPFADKIIICGGFVMLIGVAPQFVKPWFAVVILVREFLVSGLRSFLESRGVAFGAAWSGKLKMLLQSIAIPLVLFYEANLARIESGSAWQTPAEVCRALTVAFLAATLLVTVGSSFGYIRRAVGLIRSQAAAG